MNYAKLSDEYSVATQIDPADVEYFAGEGYTAVICNRPDGEDAGQPDSESIREACEQHGIVFHMIPVRGRTISPETVHQFRAVMASAPGPVLGYCRSGTRSAILWQMASQTADPR
jgi:sulfide:quinone oxidoreductase